MTLASSILDVGVDGVEWSRRIFGFSHSLSGLRFVLEGVGKLFRGSTFVGFIVQRSVFRMDSLQPEVANLHTRQ